MRYLRLEVYLGCVSPLHCCGSDFLKELLREYLRTGGLSAGLENTPPHICAMEPYERTLWAAEVAARGVTIHQYIDVMCDGTMHRCHT